MQKTLSTARSVPAFFATSASAGMSEISVIGFDGVSRKKSRVPGRTALRATDHDVAVDAADRAVTLRPDNLRYRLVAAEARLDRGSITDIDRAISEARRATQWSSKDPLAADELATALSSRAAATGDHADVTTALAQWQTLVDRDPHRAAWQLQLGRAAALAGDAERARRAWTIAASLGEPGAPPLLAALDASS